MIQVSSTCIVGNIQHLSFYKPAGYSKKSKKRERKEKKDMGPFKTLEKFKNTDKHFTFYSMLNRQQLNFVNRS